MLLSIKTLQQKVFQIEVAPESLILDLKKKIEESQGFAVSNQKLIYSGKILADDKTVGSFNIGEKDFLVVMVTKPKAAPAPKPVQPVAAAPVAADATVKPVASAPAPAAVAAVPSVAPSSSTPASAFASLATGTEYENAVNNLVEMGFDKDQVRAAMRAAFNNPDRAAEYLMTGNIPQLAAETPAPAPASEAQPAAPSDEGNLFQAAVQAAQRPQGQQPAEGDTVNDLSFLRNSPQFQQLQQLAQTQPELLQPVLQQLGQSNPQLLQMINQNQDAFMRLLFEGLEGQPGFDEGEEAGVQQIQITPEEDEAINRLVALGFDRSLAFEAYFACDKNEEMAANYLFDQTQGDF